YKQRQHIKLRLTPIQPYPPFLHTPHHTQPLIHISHIIHHYLHNLKKFLSQPQILKPKILSIHHQPNLNFSLKHNHYFNNYQPKKQKHSLLHQIKHTEKYRFQTLEQPLPLCINHSKPPIPNNNSIILNTLKPYFFN
uniref:general stress protein n=1 Tax=Staphylococcus hominis TaxID=1290 RepID=UPI0011A031B9